MADTSQVVATNTLLRTGAGRLVGMVLSCSSGTTSFNFYDNTAGSGTKILEIYVPSSFPMTIFFSERFFLDFTTGLYLAVAANGTATVWWRTY
jgi:hypothetical protein